MCRRAPFFVPAFPIGLDAARERVEGRAMAELPDPPDRDTLARYLGKMLVARGAGLPAHGEPWLLAQVTEPTETGSLNDLPVTAYEALFLAPARRDDGTYIFTDEDNEVIGAMPCSTFISPTGATCMRSLFSEIEEQDEVDAGDGDLSELV